MQSLKGLSKSHGRYKGNGMFTSLQDIRNASVSRKTHSNKYSNGSVLVVGGSAKYTGAPVLSSMAANAALSALRTGAGYATLLVEKGIGGIEKSVSPDLVVRSYSRSSKREGLLSKILSIRHDTSVLGPGIDQRGLLYRSVPSIISEESKRGRPIVVDGGAIRALLSVKRRLPASVIVTPHSGEFAALGYGVSDNLDDRMEKAVRFTQEHGCTLVLKGHETVITDGASIKVNRARTAALATMGTGDVLAGMISAYCAMNRDPFVSSVAGVTAHSMLGDLLHKKMGNHVIATDLIDALPSFLKKFDR